MRVNDIRSFDMQTGDDLFCVISRPVGNGMFRTEVTHLRAELDNIAPHMTVQTAAERAADFRKGADKYAAEAVAEYPRAYLKQDMANIFEADFFAFSEIANNPAAFPQFY